MSYHFRALAALAILNPSCVPSCRFVPCVVVPCLRKTYSQPYDNPPIILFATKTVLRFITITSAGHDKTFSAVLDLHSKHHLTYTVALLPDYIYIDYYHSFCTLRFPATTTLFLASLYFPDFVMLLAQSFNHFLLSVFTIGCFYPFQVVHAGVLDLPQNYRKYQCLTLPPLVCTFQPTTGYNVTGSVLFESRYWGKRGCVVRISAELQGLTSGLHGFHIHQFGDIRSPSGASTGGHFVSPTAPTGDLGFHSYWWRASSSDQPHWGDFGNIYANESGLATYKRVDTRITLAGIVGRGMIVHADRDKGPKFQPSGESGARQSQCVIGFAQV